MLTASAGMTISFSMTLETAYCGPYQSEDETFITSISVFGPEEFKRYKPISALIGKFGQVFEVADSALDTVKAE